MKKTQIDHQAPAPSAPATANVNASHANADTYLKSLSDIRRTRLSLLIEQRAAGNVARFAEDLGYSRSQMHQFLSPAYNDGKSIGELAARQLEQRASLQFGWLDGDAPNIWAAPAKAGTTSVPRMALHPKDHAKLMGEVAHLVSPAWAERPQPEFTFDKDELQSGEMYAGIVKFGGIYQHLILLPAEARNVSWQQARTFAGAVGGELPDLDDYEVLLQNLPQEFSEDDSYWSSEYLDRDQALYLAFGSDPFRDWDWVNSLDNRARAVRRIFAGREERHPSVLVDWHKHLKTAREAVGMAPDQLAELIKVSPDVIARWEAGEVRTIDGPMLMTVCAVLNVDSGWLLGADGE